MLLRRLNITRINNFAASLINHLYTLMMITKHKMSIIFNQDCTAVLFLISPGEGPALHRFERDFA